MDAFYFALAENNDDLNIANGDEMHSFTLSDVTTKASTPIAFQVSVGGLYTINNLETNATGAGVVTLCFQRGMPPQDGKCTFKMETTMSGFLAPVVQVPTYEGTYYMTATTNATLPVSISGNFTVAACEMLHIQIEGNCVAAASLKTAQEVTTVANVAQTVYYTVPVVVHATYPSNVFIKYAGQALLDLKIRAAFGNNDMASATTFAANMTNLGLVKTYDFRMPSTIGGTWYFAIELTTNTSGSSTFSLDESSVCEKGTEATCTDAVATLNVGTTMIQGTASAALSYVMYNATDLATWKVSISTQQGIPYNSVMNIYVANGYAPYVGQNGVIADWVHGCTLAADLCSQMTTIELPKLKTPYFIAVSYHNATLASTPYLLWVPTTSVCPPCTHGACPTTQPNNLYGKCKCNYGWGGINCAIPVGSYWVQIIVVITIGALLLVTAIVGLIAWFISKRKANKAAGYERV